jgi:hypothetical protein
VWHKKLCALDIDVHSVKVVCTNYGCDACTTFWHCVVELAHVEYGCIIQNWCVKLIWWSITTEN